MSRHSTDEVHCADPMDDEICEFDHPEPGENAAMLGSGIVSITYEFDGELYEHEFAPGTQGIADDGVIIISGPFGYTADGLINED